MDIIDRLNAVTGFIEENLAGDIQYAEIARVACSSQYHFQRIFTAITGIPLSEYIRRRKLTQAAYDIQNSDDRMIEIALRYGYGSPDSFARAFKVLHGIAPSQAKTPGVKLKAYPRIVFTLSIKGGTAMHYRMVEKEGFRIVGIREWTTFENGQNFVNIPGMWCKLSPEDFARLASLADTDLTGILGVCADVYDGGFDYWIAAATTKPCPPGWEEKAIPALTWAVFEVVGPIPGAIQEVTRRIFSEWLPNSGYEHAEAPELEWYAEGDMNADDYRCEVWIPVVKK